MNVTVTRGILGVNIASKSTWRFYHLGIPVWDLDKTLKNYAVLGNASIEPEFLIDSRQAEQYLVYGKRPDPAILTRGAFVKIGGLVLELLQPLEGHTVHKEKLESTGEGVGHIAYIVDALEAEVSELEAKGLSVILSVTPPGQKNRTAVYIDTRDKFSNLIIELIQKP